MLVIRVRGDAGHAEHDSDMLKPPVRIEQLRTDGADTGFLRVFEHRREPVGP